MLPSNLTGLFTDCGDYTAHVVHADGSITFPAGLLKKKGRLNVWLIGEHPLGRLKLMRTISMTD
ncbi:MAG: hypothetical protein P1U87_04150 [Verrucomicrobiales bacterium]|nr:hypothetical protein [Verrucomicrobiales bacterium]